MEGYQLRTLKVDDEEYKYINSRMIKTLSVNHNNGVKLESYEICKVITAVPMYKCYNYYDHYFWIESKDMLQPIHVILFYIRMNCNIWNSVKCKTPCEIV